MPIAPTHPNPHAPEYRAAGHWPQQPLGDLLARTAERHPTQMAIIDGARRLRFAELDRLVQRVALGFGARGFGPGDVIAYQLPN